jgi:hypothetical protein
MYGMYEGLPRQHQWSSLAPCAAEPFHSTIVLEPMANKVSFLELQLKLVHGLGFGPEPVPIVPCQLMFQLGDLQSLSLHQIKQTFGCVAKIIRIRRQGFEGLQHDGSIPGPCWNMNPIRLAWLKYSLPSAVSMFSWFDASQSLPKESTTGPVSP